jgi:short-subunit dehydrogenase
MTPVSTVLVTGATGGIGAAVVGALLEAGHAVLATGRDAAALEKLRQRYPSDQARLSTFPADLANADDLQAVVAHARDWCGGVDVLINNAGCSLFGQLESQSPEAVSRVVELNLIVPMVLTQALLPTLRRHFRAHVINVGSVFGAIGYAGNVAYCASKFGLRGMTEALRRELADTNIQVHLVAPRATRTTMNQGAVDALNLELGNQTDSPEQVAEIIVRRLETGSGNRVIGLPERFFARLNAVFPSIVDRALHKQLPVIQRHAKSRSHS